MDGMEDAVLLVLPNEPGYPTSVFAQKQELLKSMPLWTANVFQLEDNAVFVAFAPKEDQKLLLLWWWKMRDSEVLGWPDLYRILMEKYLNDTISKRKPERNMRFTQRPIKCPSIWKGCNFVKIPSVRENGLKWHKTAVILKNMLCTRVVKFPTNKKRPSPKTNRTRRISYTTWWKKSIKTDPIRLFIRRISIAPLYPRNWLERCMDLFLTGSNRHHGNIWRYLCGRWSRTSKLPGFQKQITAKAALFFIVALGIGLLILLTDSKFFGDFQHLVCGRNSFITTCFSISLQSEGNESIIRLGGFQFQPAEFCVKYVLRLHWQSTCHDQIRILAKHVRTWLPPL